LILKLRLKKAREVKTIFDRKKESKREKGKEEKEKGKQKAFNL